MCVCVRKVVCVGGGGLELTVLGYKSLYEMKCNRFL